jgi:hypothetical protein
MKFKTRAAMQSAPTFHVDARLDPVQVQGGLHGSGEAHVGPISVSIGEIPVRFVVPFLKRRRRQVMLGSIGGFDISLRPLQVGVKGLEVQVQGVLGPKGLSGSADGKVDCTTEVQMEGDVVGSVGRVIVELGEADKLDPEQVG